MKSLLISLLLTSLIFGQETDDVFIIKPTMKFGTMFSGFSYWKFSAGYWNDDLTYNINPNILIGIGIESKDIELLSSAKITFSIEASFGKAKTKETILTGSPADFKVTSIPILFWTKLKSSGKLAPFVRLGIGYEKSEIKETYYRRPSYGFKADDWFFCYGIGAGIDFNFFKKIKLSLFVDGLIKEHGFYISINEPRKWWTDLDFRNSNMVTGLEFSYNF